MCGCSEEKAPRPVLDVFACPELVEEREAACAGCDRLIRVVEMCGVCKCLLTVKRRLKASKCPQGKW